MKAAMPVALLSALAATVSAQAAWTPTPAGPSPREGAHLVHDSVSQRWFLLLGRSSSGTSTADLVWSWNGTAWTQQVVSFTSSFSHLGLGGACAEGSGSVIVFGGYRPPIGTIVPATVFDETWRVQPTGPGSVQLILLSPAAHPLARQGCGLVATPVGPVMFGGGNADDSVFFNDTWRWTGTTWTQLVTPTSPPVRSFHAMALDPVRLVLVVFGGAVGPTNLANDTWEFDGADWHQRFPAHTPPARCRASCFWSPVNNCTIVSGGGNLAFTTQLSDAWAWDGADWHELFLTNPPSARQSVATAWDPVAQKALCFGGRDAQQYFADSTHLDVPAWPRPSYTPFGTGCPGPTGLVPQLAPAPNEVPAVGTTSHLVVGNLPVGLTLPIFVLAFSNTFDANGGYPLPFDLGGFGWPGCDQRVSADVLIAVPTLTGQADYALTWPRDASLLGFTYHAQALVLYTPTGGATTNGLTGVVGL